MKLSSYPKLIGMICLVGVLGGAHFVHAQLPVTDTGAINAIGTANGILDSISQASVSTQQSTATIQTTTTQNKVQKSIKDAITAVAYSVAQQISRKLVSLAINEINGGASGLDHPQQFISDFGQMIQSATDRAVTIYTKGLIASSSNPFAAQVGVNLTNQYAKLGTTQLNSFSLNNYSAGNWANSATNLSNSGIYGWDYYMQSGLPQNNPTGSGLIAKKEVAVAVDTAQNIQNKQISTSGYKPKQTPCSISYNPNAGAPEIAADQAKLSAAQDALVTAENATVNGGQPTPAQVVAVNDAENNVNLAQQALQAVQDKSTSANVEYGTSCANQVITNPVGAVDTLAQQAITAPFKDLEKQSQWYTLLANALVQFAQGMINTGISHLKLNQQDNSSLNSNSLHH